jgi:hypothetical protein
MYSSTLSLTSALDGVGGQRHAPVALHPGKPSTHCTGWDPRPVWTGAENLAPLGFDPRTFHPIVSRYND